MKQLQGRRKWQCSVCGTWSDVLQHHRCWVCSVQFGAATITKQEAEIAVRGVVAEAVSDYEWGGDEDEYGTLQPGYPDFDRLQQSLLNIVQMVKEGA